MQTLYTAIATSTGGRDGRAISSDNILDVKLATPKELGGAGGAATNPEQLFAAGYSACFIGALKFVASQTKRTIRTTPRSPPTSASARSLAVSVWTSTCTSACRALNKPMRNPWSMRPTRSARTPTPPVATSMCVCTSPSNR
jgi:hypothetical protein